MTPLAFLHARMHAPVALGAEDLTAEAVGVPLLVNFVLDVRPEALCALGCVCVFVCLFVCLFSLFGRLSDRPV
jgi:hypothetical protein